MTDRTFRDDLLQHWRDCDEMLTELSVEESNIIGIAHLSAFCTLMAARGLKVVPAEAVEHVAHYVKMRDALPMRGLDDQIHGIHSGSPYAAELHLSKLRLIAAPDPLALKSEGE